MFENLSERLTRTLRSVAGKSRLSDENISEALRDVRTALLEADVALEVVKDFIEHIRVRAPRCGGRTKPDAGPGAREARARRAGRS